MSDPANYTVGCICALTTEFVAMQNFLDKRHDPPAAVALEDDNNYALGTAGNHFVVIAVLPHGEYGLVSAASVAKDMLHTFPNIRFGLMVGIGGGAPSPHHDIRLGDVVVSCPKNSKTGVIQYDFGKTIQNQKFLQTGTLNKPPQVVLTAVAGLEARYESDGHQLEDAIGEILQKKARLQKKYSRPSTDNDRLYKTDFIHRVLEADCQDTCGDDLSTLVSRHQRNPQAGEDKLTVHYGLIASANTLMKDARVRDKLSAENGVLCFEMEAAGLMDRFPCLVIRGICDYSDSHKNKRWQGYAAMAAAAYAKDLLCQIPPNKLELERRVTDVLNDVQNNVNHLQSLMGVMKNDVCAMRHDSYVANLESWLSPTDPSIGINSARKSRHTGTGYWFLESKPFIEWERGSRCHLWLSGLPGCGKTVLTSTIYDYLTRKEDYVTLLFLFDFQDIRRQELDAMLRSMIFQLYCSRQGSRIHLERAFTSHSGGRNQPTTSTLSTCFEDMLIASKNVFILLDALDESSQRRETLEWIQNLIQTLPNIQLITTSRLEGEFERIIPHCIGEKNCINLSNDLLHNDIRCYITHRLYSKEFKRWSTSPDILTEIEKTVGDKADGMFRWAACQLDSLAECLSREELEDALQSLPSDLNTTYRCILENIPKRHKEKAIRLLQFLAHASRPLDIEEAIDITAVRLKSTGAGYFNALDRLPCPEDIKKYVSSLVSLTHASDGDGILELQLAHFSVKEYLVNQDIDGLPDARVLITEICLAYLGSIQDVNVIEHDDGYYLDDTVLKYPFATRAAEILMENAKHAENSAKTLDAIINFLQDKSKFLTWVNLLQPDESHEWWWDDEMDRTTASPLYFACFNGLEATAKRLLFNGANINAPGAYHGSPLRAAASKGDEAMVRLLLNNGADVNAQYSVYGTALQAASENGHWTVVRLLLEYGATELTKYGSALIAACEQGNESAVQLLLAHGSDASEITALHAASSQGHEAIVKILLQHGADANATHTLLGSVLQAASKEGHDEIVQLLVEYGAEISDSDAGTRIASNRGDKAPELKDKTESGQLS